MTDVVLDFFADRGEATREAQLLIRGSLRGSYRIVIMSETIAAINYGLLGFGMTFSEAQEALNGLFQLVSVIEMSDAGNPQFEMRKNNLSSEELTNELLRRNGIEAIVTNADINYEHLNINVFSPYKFLFLFKDLVE